MPSPTLQDCVPVDAPGAAARAVPTQLCSDSGQCSVCHENFWGHGAAAHHTPETACWIPRPVPVFLVQWACLAHIALCVWCEWVSPWAVLNTKAFRESSRSCITWKHQFTVESCFFTLIAVPTMLTVTLTHATVTTGNNLTAAPSHYSGLKSLWNQEPNKPLNCLFWVLGHHYAKISGTC